jgi:subtilisin
VPPGTQMQGTSRVTGRGKRALSSLRSALELTLEKLQGMPLEPVEVAVVDSGIDATHSDLTNRVTFACWVHTSPRGPKVDERALAQDNDAYGHGTGVAGVIAQIAPNARLLDVRVLDEGNCGQGEILVAGFRWAVERGVRLINLSLASKARFAPQLHELCEQAYRQNQVVVAAKRNMPLVDNGFPAELSTCIGVDLDQFPSPFTLRYRPEPPIEYVARGVEVMTTARGGGYTPMTGTSFATPTVAGLCALLIGAYPDLRPFEVKTLLKVFATT